jgi:hypothetical protein
MKKLLLLSLLAGIVVIGGVVFLNYQLKDLDFELDFSDELSGRDKK